MFDRANEKTPLIKTKSVIEMRAKHTNEVVLAMVIEALNNAIINNELTLTDEDIQGLTALSLTRKSMYKLLHTTNPLSPLHHMPTDFILHQVNCLLNFKSQDNHKRMLTKSYLEKLIHQLKASTKQPCFRSSEVDAPPPDLGLWNHDKISGTVNALTFLSITISLSTLDFMGKLPLTEAIQGIFTPLRDNNSLESIDDIVSSLAFKLMALIVYAGISLLIGYPLIHPINRILETIWLSNAEKDLASLTYYPQVKLEEYKAEKERLDAAIAHDKSNNIELSLTKGATLTLFSNLDKLKKIKHFDIEANPIHEAEPQLRRRANN